MAGVHIHWHKRAFRAQWVLCGAPGYIGSIAPVRDAPDVTPSYAWSVRRAEPAGPGDPVASGVAATLSDARLLASRAAFAALRLPSGRPALGSAWAHQSTR